MMTDIGVNQWSIALGMAIAIHLYGFSLLNNPKPIPSPSQSGGNEIVVSLSNDERHSVTEVEARETPNSVDNLEVISAQTSSENIEEVLNLEATASQRALEVLAATATELEAAVVDQSSLIDSVVQNTASVEVGALETVGSLETVVEEVAVVPSDTTVVPEDGGVSEETIIENLETTAALDAVPLVQTPSSQASETVEEITAVTVEPLVSRQIAIAESVAVVDQNSEVEAITAPSTAVETLEENAELIVSRAVTLEELVEQSVGDSGVTAQYVGKLIGWLRKNSHYPRAARVAGQEGKVTVTFAIDREGNVSNLVLETPSGYPLLDREAMEMIERSDPFPIMPADMSREKLELRIPVTFDIDDQSLYKTLPPVNLE